MARTAGKSGSRTVWSGLLKALRRQVLPLLRFFGWRSWAVDAGDELILLLEEAYAGSPNTWEAFIRDTLGITDRRLREWVAGERPKRLGGLAANLDKIHNGWERRFTVLAAVLGRAPSHSRARPAAALGVMLALGLAMTLRPSGPGEVAIGDPVTLEDYLPPFPPPQNLKPDGSKQHRDTRILHSWDAVPGAIFYELQFLNTRPHTSAIFGDQIRMIQGTSAYFDHQSRHCPIYWQVRAVDGSGQRSPWTRASYEVDCDQQAF